MRGWREKGTKKKDADVERVLIESQVNVNLLHSLTHFALSIVFSHEL